MNRLENLLIEKQKLEVKKAEIHQAVIEHLLQEKMFPFFSVNYSRLYKMFGMREKRVDRDLE